MKSILLQGAVQLKHQSLFSRSCYHWRCPLATSSFLFLVAMPGAPSSVLAPFVAMPFVPSGKHCSDAPCPSVRSSNRSQQSSIYPLRLHENVVVAPKDRAAPRDASSVSTEQHPPPETTRKRHRAPARTQSRDLRT